jgi:hypothetical protein
MPVRILLIACTALLGLSLYGHKALAGAYAPRDAARIEQPATGVLTLVRGGHGHGGHHGGGHRGGGHHGHAMHFRHGHSHFHAFHGRHHGWYAGRWRHGGRWHGRRGYWRHGRWFWYGGGSCYWNCINAGFGPAYCSVNAWRFCY